MKFYKIYQKPEIVEAYLESIEHLFFGSEYHLDFRKPYVSFCTSDMDLVLHLKQRFTLIKNWN